ncbi:MAG: monovalent cation/H(+) antiporter subunit G [Phenylobacterium sp.]|uniref:monovalent cation/H(+) antiporter subunit G n=1 Tax=Phenylobacterium sp. TaxID=1871053 RepID=UPI002736DCCF|nr:monovalent cation/H(+) antiporter subunit G [Phenylobacterium sp.]MDP3173327.1 monovalent cation/H(+) antiporter subunit G [Phenylobacterium sp.]
MNATAELPVWAAVVVSAGVLAGALLVLTGTIGLVRLGSFYQRVHAPTLGTTLGMFLILVSSTLYFSVTQERLALHEALIAVFLTLTTPISLMLVVRAALYRDRQAGDAAVPSLKPSAATDRRPPEE